MYYIILLFTSILRAAFCDFFLRFTEAEYNYRQKKNPKNTEHNEAPRFRHADRLGTPLLSLCYRLHKTKPRK